MGGNSPAWLLLAAVLAYRYSSAVVYQAVQVGEVAHPADTLSPCLVSWGNWRTDRPDQGLHVGGCRQVSSDLRPTGH